jgi:hypothetical protein
VQSHPGENGTHANSLFIAPTARFTGSPISSRTDAGKPYTALKVVGAAQAGRLTAGRRLARNGGWNPGVGATVEEAAVSLGAEAPGRLPQAQRREWPQGGVARRPAMAGQSTGNQDVAVLCNTPTLGSWLALPEQV